MPSTRRVGNGRAGRLWARCRALVAERVTDERKWASQALAPGTRVSLSAVPENPTLPLGKLD
jgi:hypothetical protein